MGLYSGSTRQLCQPPSAERSQTTLPMAPEDPGSGRDALRDSSALPRLTRIPARGSSIYGEGTFPRRSTIDIPRPVPPSDSRLVFTTYLSPILTMPSLLACRHTCSKCAYSCKKEGDRKKHERTSAPHPACNKSCNQYSSLTTKPRKPNAVSDNPLGFGSSP